MTIESITISPQRSIGNLDIDCTIREQGTDVYTPTNHPVEQGAAITDHVYRNPSQLVMEIGFSNSSAQAGGSNDYVNQTYADLLAMQGDRLPLTIVTGKRTYQNMIITSLAVTTDETTEAILACTVTCREIIIVQTQVTTVGPSDVQAEPQKTADPLDRGTVQPIDAALSPDGSLPIFTSVKEVPLLAAAQSFEIQLKDTVYNVGMQWRDAVAGGGWFMDLADNIGNQIIGGIPLVTGANLLEQFDYLGIGGQLIVQTDNDTDQIPAFDALGQLSHLYFAVAA